MSTATIVYLASISGNLQPLFGGFGAVFCLVSCIIFGVSFSDDNYKWNMKIIRPICGIVFFIGIMSITICSMIPSGENIYKIAGVTSQEKSSIDASGKLLQNVRK